jgi:hypothetical protein
MRADVMLDPQFAINSAVTFVSTVRGPHLDKPYKLFAAILYMQHPDDDSLNVVEVDTKARIMDVDRAPVVADHVRAPIDFASACPNQG